MQPDSADIRVRVATSEDIPEVLALWAAARSSAAVTPDTLEGLTALIAHTEDALLVAERQGHIVGAIVAAWDGWRAHMYRLAVLPEHRRRGIARRLVDEGHARLRAKGAPRVTALVAEDEAEATGLWLAVGYAHNREFARFVRNL